MKERDIATTFKKGEHMGKEEKRIQKIEKDLISKRKKLAELQESVKAAEKEQNELVGKVVTDYINAENIELTDLLSVLGVSEPEKETEATAEEEQSL